MSDAWNVSTYADALAGLHDRRDELGDVPLRLHVHEVQLADLLGSPRMSPEFWRHLTGSVHATVETSREVWCPDDGRAEHGERCPRCRGLGSWTTTHEIYARPLARALWLAARRRSGLRPHPVLVVSALLAEGCDLRRAMARLGQPTVSVDHLRTQEGLALSAIRAVRECYDVTTRARRVPWTEMSEAQQAAEIGTAT